MCIRDRAYRGRHFANYIMSTMISVAYAQGIRNFRIATHDKNDRVHNLVQNFGFVKRGKVYTCLLYTSVDDYRLFPINRVVLDHGKIA